jgi:hypothetical protein
MGLETSLQLFLVVSSDQKDGGVPPHRGRRVTWEKGGALRKGVISVPGRLEVGAIQQGRRGVIDYTYVGCSIGWRLVPVVIRV